MRSISYSNGMRRRIVTYENINVTEFEAKNNQKGRSLRPMGVPAIFPERVAFLLKLRLGFMTLDQWVPFILKSSCQIPPGGLSTPS